jgi:predicted transcriptional regulator
MGKTKLTGKLVHLEPGLAKVLEKMAKERDMKQSTLMRTAIDEYLDRKGYKWDRTTAVEPVRRVHTLRKHRKP